MDLLVIFWLPIVVGVGLGSVVSFGPNAGTGEHAYRRAMWVWLGALLMVGGMAVTLGGFGSLWIASIEGRSEVPGAVTFLCGAAITFVGIGLVNGRDLRSAEE